MLEHGIEGKVTQWADAHNVLHTKLNLQGRCGWPDRVFWLTLGKPVLIEFKRPSKEPEPLQAYTHHRLRKLGYDVKTFSSAEKACDYLASRINCSQGLGTASIPKTSRAVSSKTMRSRSVSRSRTWKDKRHTKGS